MMDLYTRAIIGSLAFSLISMIIVFLVAYVVMCIFRRIRLTKRINIFFAFFISWMIIGLYLPIKSLGFYMNNRHELYLAELALAVVFILIFSFIGKSKVNS